MTESSRQRNDRIDRRKRLFKIWSETGSVTDACREAGISRAGFYYWKKRFIEGGYSALSEEKSHAPLNPRKISDEFAEQAIRLKRENPEWGKSLICRTINQKHGANVISPNTVRRVLMDAGLW